MNNKSIKLLKTVVLVLSIGFMVTNVNSQEKSKRQLKKEQKEKEKLVKEKETEDLVNAKTFIFVAQTALPTGTRSIDLTTNPNFLKFKPNLIDSDMPFFGRAYNVNYGSNDSGLKFKGEPSKFDIEKDKKGYKINAEVKDNNDHYRIFINVGFEGRAYLTINSNNRGAINYNGSISELKSETVED